MSDLDLDGLYGTPAAPSLAQALPAPPVAAPPVAIVPATAPLPQQSAAQLAYNANLAQAVQAQAATGTDATVRALRSVGAVPDNSGMGGPLSSAPAGNAAPAAAAPNPFAQRNAVTRIPAMTIPTADPKLRAQLASENQAEQGGQVAEMGGQEALDEAKAKTADASAQSLDAKAAEEKREGDEAKARADKDASDDAAHYASIAQAKADLGAKQIDPGRLYANMSTGQKIMSRLAQAFGAAGATLGHTQNFALDKMQAEIAADVDAQKHDLENGYRSIEGQETAYEHFRNKGFTVKDSTQLANGLLLDHVKDQNDAIVAGTASPQIQAQGVINRSKLEQAISQTANRGTREQIATSRYLPASVASAMPGMGGYVAPKVRAAIDKVRAKNVDTDESIRAMRDVGQHLEPGESIPGTSFTDQVRHAISPRVESDDAIKYGGHLDTLIARDLGNQGVRRITPDTIAHERAKYTSPANVAGLVQRVQQRNSEEERIAADAAASGSAIHYAAPAATAEGDGEEEP
jgi:hypothetical protein